MSYQITSTAASITALNGTISDPNYFNALWNVTDCVVTEVTDLTPLTAEQIATAQAQAQANASLLNQIQANRNAYIDALINGDTTSQSNIQTAQSTLYGQAVTAGLSLPSTTTTFVTSANATATLTTSTGTSNV